jgi:phosphopantothenoylcysteine decarboxylase / phosphopantothenate---cysteine ligase
MTTERREIILGVGGGIAAYKSCDLLRRLRERGFNVTVVPTPSSLNFVGKATWEALSGREVTASVFESVDQVRHVSLAKLAEAIIIAPATADLIARMAQGRADDLLTNVILASTSPILIVPAMHPAMWSNSATVENIRILKSRGIQVMEPEIGALTSGDTGKGRFPATASILETFMSSTLSGDDLRGKKVLVTAGGTREAIDPVRYIGNHSSGKQGVAIAHAALHRGADVTLIAANVQEGIDSKINLIRVESADQMLKELVQSFADADFLFMAAAVADARVSNKVDEKIKKNNLVALNLVENPDLLLAVKDSKDKQIIVAFAAETEVSKNVDEALNQVRAKMNRKGADFIYLNDVSHGEIFGSDETRGWLVSTVDVAEIATTTKKSLANLLINSAVRSAHQLS